MGNYTILSMFGDVRKSQERQASKIFYNKCSENSRSQIVFRTDIFRKLPLGAPVDLAKPKTSRQKQNTSRQKQKPHGKTENLTAKTKYLTTKAKTSRQKQRPHDKTKYFTVETKIPTYTSRQKQIPTAKPKLFYFCCEVFGFAVRFLVLP